MRLKEKLALYNAVTKAIVILVLGAIILVSIDKIANKHLDNRLLKKYDKLISNLSDKEVDSLIITDKTFTDFNILKDEYIVLSENVTALRTDTNTHFSTEDRELKGDIESYRILSRNFNYKNSVYHLELGLNTSGTTAIKNTLRLYLFVVLIMALSISLIIDLSFYKVLLAPFYKIINQKLLATKHPVDYDFKKIPTSTSDFILLDDSINLLMKRIADNFRLERQFIANASHELLTPISVLNSRLENILAAENLTSTQEDKLLASLKTLNKLKKIINSLLLISKIENEQYTQEDQLKLSSEIQEVLEELDDRIRDKHIKVFQKFESDYQFLGNKVLFSILLINIISNAIKYNRNDGQIHIRFEKTATQGCLTISDTGIGIPENIIYKIFERFERANNLSNTEGHGLGLAIAKSIASFHNITITINSEENKGSEVKLFFQSNL